MIFFIKSVEMLFRLCSPSMTISDNFISDIVAGPNRYCIQSATEILFSSVKNTIFQLTAVNCHTLVSINNSNSGKQTYRNRNLWNKTIAMSDNDEPKKPTEKKKFVVRTPTDVQRIRLEKLMANPQKEIVINTVRTKKSADLSEAVPNFVRNVMGSSAGAGSGEFHVYRHLRRKEFARQKQIEQKSRQEQLDDEFQEKIEQNKLKAESRTAKKRAKRLKQKEKAKQRKLNPKASADESKSASSDEESADEDDGTETPATDKDQAEGGNEPKGDEETNATKKDGDGDETEGGNEPKEVDE